MLGSDLPGSWWGSSDRWVSPSFRDRVHIVVIAFPTFWLSGWLLGQGMELQPGSWWSGGSFPEPSCHYLWGFFTGGWEWDVLWERRLWVGRCGSHPLDGTYLHVQPLLFFHEPFGFLLLVSCAPCAVVVPGLLFF